MTIRHWVVCCLAALALTACGSNAGDNGDGGVGGGGGDGDGGIGMDAPFSGMCSPGSAQCSNCIDDDNDGLIDGFDPECSGPLDNDESSFATGIPGDNIDKTDQDCFFDGNSGQGNDGCNQHTCCLLGAPDKATCAQLAPLANANKYDIAQCYPPVGMAEIPPKCTMVCGGITPPGCDCFGCCTLCDGANCFDIAINPVISPGCDPTNISDPNICKRCTKTENCGSSECGGDTCVLCPGQDPSTLPSSCGGMNECPMGYEACGADNSCPVGTYCSAGCCIGTIL